MRLYINGVQVTTRARTVNMVTSTNPLRIGGNNLWGEGLIDEVRVYNRVPTAAEIQADRNAPIQP